MWHFWQHFLRPFCEILQPSTIVEVGSLGGINTKNLVAYCKEHDAKFHMIDPVLLKPEQIREVLGDVGTVHQDISLAVLDKLPADLFLLDGDHNWYTVLHELRAIERCATKYDRPFPVVCLHDIGWPYGRRDLYYAPERIPAEFRQPYAQQELDVDEPDLLESGGFNLKHHNAFREGGPRNSVLTAIEEFVQDSDDRYRLLQIPGFHGLGVVYSPDALGPEISEHLERQTEIP